MLTPLGMHNDCNKPLVGLPPSFRDINMHSGFNQPPCCSVTFI